MGWGGAWAAPSPNLHPSLLPPLCAGLPKKTGIPAGAGARWRIMRVSAPPRPKHGDPPPPPKVSTFPLKVNLPGIWGLPPPPPGMCVGVSLSSPPLPPLSHPPQGFGSVVLVVLALTHPVSSSRPPPPPLSQNTTQARFWCLRPPPPPPQMLLPAPPQPSASSWQHFPSHWFVPPSPPLGGVQPQGVAMGRGLKHCGVGGGVL